MATDDGRQDDDGPAPSAGAVDAVVLAGGAGRRFGGDKTAATVGGTSLLGRVVAAADAAGVGAVVVVGPRLPDDAEVGCRLVRTREDPPGSGPVAGLQAGLRLTDADVVVLLAADLPRLAPGVVGFLVDTLAARPDLDAVVAEDDSGRAQWLTAAYRTAPLRDAVDDVLRPAGGDADGEVRSPGLRSVVRSLRWAAVRLPAGWGRLVDVDTPQDLSRARLDDWALRLVDELDLGPATAGLDAPVLVDLVLDLARDAAHTVARPAAPLTTFALGAAAGLAAGAGGHADLEGLRDRLLAMLPASDDAAPTDGPAGQSPAGDG